MVGLACPSRILSEHDLEVTAPAPSFAARIRRFALLPRIPDAKIRGFRSFRPHSVTPSIPLPLIICGRGTAVVLRKNAFKDIASEMQQFMKKEGYKKLSDLKLLEK
jgi:hypothetical protein